MRDALLAKSGILSSGHRSAVPIPIAKLSETNSTTKADLHASSFYSVKIPSCLSFHPIAGTTLHMHNGVDFQKRSLDFATLGYDAQKKKNGKRPCAYANLKKRWTNEKMPLHPLTQNQNKLLSYKTYPCKGRVAISENYFKSDTALSASNVETLYLNRSFCDYLCMRSAHHCLSLWTATLYKGCIVYIMLRFQKLVVLQSPKVPLAFGYSCMA